MLKKVLLGIFLGFYLDFCYFWVFFAVFEYFQQFLALGYAAVGSMLRHIYQVAIVR